VSPSVEPGFGDQIWPVALTALLAFAGVFAARTYFGQPSASPTATDAAPSPSLAAPPASGKAELDGGEDSPFEFLKGRWVTSHTTCQTTNNFIDFGVGGYKAYVHDRQWLDHGGRGFYWRRGSLLMVRNGGNTRTAILVFKYLQDDKIVFFDAVFDGEKSYDEYAYRDPDAPTGSDLAPEFHSVATKPKSATPARDPNDEWRQDFRTYLGTLKRCAGVSAQ
jgi:hypothetical protein